MRIFNLWRRPAQLGDGPRNAYLLSLATASATWRQPAQRVSFYLWRRPAQLGDGPRNLLTPGNTELGETSTTYNFLIFGFVPVERAINISEAVVASANAEMLD